MFEATIYTRGYSIIDRRRFDTYDDAESWVIWHPRFLGIANTPYLIEKV